MPLTIRTLKDGYWDLTTLVRAMDGMLRVRKESRETQRNTGERGAKRGKSNERENVTANGP